MHFLYNTSYIMHFLAEVSSKYFPYYYPWQTSYAHHLLNSLGSIHLPTCFKVPRVVQVQLPSLSIAGYSFTAQ